MDDYFDSIDDFGNMVEEPSMEPSGEPSEEPQVDEFRLYLTETTLVDARPAPRVERSLRTVATMSIPFLQMRRCAYTRGQRSPPFYQGGDMDLNLSMDTQSVGQTVQTRVQIDIDGDGTVDVERLFEFWALDAAVGNWEIFTTPNAASSTGVWSDMNNGTVRLDVWSSFGGDTIQYAIPESYVVLPIE